MLKQYKYHPPWWIMLIGLVFFTIPGYFIYRTVYQSEPLTFDIVLVSIMAILVALFFVGLYVGNFNSTITLHSNYIQFKTFRSNRRIKYTDIDWIWMHAGAKGMIEMDVDEERYIVAKPWLTIADYEEIKQVLQASVPLNRQHENFKRH